MSQKPFTKKAPKSLTVPDKREYEAPVRLYNAFLAETGTGLSFESLSAFWKTLSDLKPATRNKYRAAVLEGIRCTLEGTTQAKFIGEFERFFKRRLKREAVTLGVSSDRLHSEFERKIMLAGMEKRWSLLYQALNETGARISEMLSCSTEHAAVRGDFVAFAVTRKGGRPGELLIHRKLVQEIRKAFGSDSPLLFHNDDRPFTREYITRLSDQQSRFLTGKPYHAHLTRHGTARRALSRKIPIEKASAILGHMNQGTTAKMYGGVQVDPADLAVLNGYTLSQRKNGEETFRAVISVMPEIGIANTISYLDRKRKMVVFTLLMHEAGDKRAESARRSGLPASRAEIVEGIKRFQRALKKSGK